VRSNFWPSSSNDPTSGPISATARNSVQNHRCLTNVCWCMADEVAAKCESQGAQQLHPTGPGNYTYYVGGEPDFWLICLVGQGASIHLFRATVLHALSVCICKCGCQQWQKSHIIGCLRKEPILACCTCCSRQASARQRRLRHPSEQNCVVQSRQWSPHAPSSFVCAVRLLTTTHQSR
jgi:hypothetical protein